MPSAHQSVRPGAAVRAFLATAAFLLCSPLLQASEVIRSPFWPTTELEFTTGGDGTPAQVNAKTGAPLRLAAPAGEASLADTGPSAMLAFVNRERRRFGVSADELEVLHAGDVMGRSYLTARQLVDGCPVINTRVLLRFGRGGGLVLWGADVVRGERAARSWEGSLDEQAAARALEMRAGLPGSELRSARKVWVRGEEGLRPAWQLQLSSRQPFARPLGLVDAASGEVLGLYDEVCTVAVDGTVEGPVYPYNEHDELVQRPLANQDLLVDTALVRTDSDGAFFRDGFATGDTVTYQGSLHGTWVEIHYDDGPDGSLVRGTHAPSTDTLLWAVPEDARSDEVNAYWHVDWIHGWYKQLDSSFTALDFAMPVHVGMSGEWAENAFSAGDMLGFGRGGANFNNFALNADVVYHEYTHSVTWGIYPPGVLPYSGQSGAMNEAWSDYFPSSIHDNPGMARGIYRNNPDGALRNLDNDNRYPEDFIGQVHHDGLIIGGAMWDLRGLVGDSLYVDSLLHFAKYSLANDFEGYLLEVLVADDDNDDLSDGTPHSEQIYQAFGDHGIGPGADPVLVIAGASFDSEDEHGVLPPGGGGLRFQLVNDVFLYPPPATGVQVEFSSRSGLVQFDEPTLQVGELGPSDTVAVGPAAYTATSQTAPSYEWVRFQVTADGGYLMRDSVRVVVGEPRVLVVDDGGETSYLPYIHRHFERLGTAAASVRTSEEAVELADFAGYQVVEWITGDVTAPLTPEEGDLLVSHLGGGGSLLLSGQHVGPSAVAHPQLAERLGLATWEDASEEYGGFGVTGEPLSEGMVFLAEGAGGAQNQEALASFGVVEGARPLYRYFQGQGVAAVYNDPADGGKAVTFGFGVEALTGYSTADSAHRILEPLLLELGLVLDAPEPGGSELAPVAFELLGPWPNPFNPAARVAFTLPERAPVRLTVHNTMGREVMRLVDGVRAAGRHEVLLNLEGRASGLYLVRLHGSGRTATSKALLLK